MSIISVIGGGWSFKYVDHNKVPGQIIAVNDSLVYLQCPCAYVVSMDRLWTENRWEQITTAKYETFIRDSVVKKYTPSPEWTWFHQFKNNRFPNTPFSDDIRSLNGGSSGACAVNLAYIKKPKTVYLFGFDMSLEPKTGLAHWYPKYPWAPREGSGYSHWPYDFMLYAKQFKEAGIEVIVVNKTSRITCFPKLSARELGVAL